MRLAQIGRDHSRVAAYLVRRALGDLAAIIKHNHPVGYVHHHTHIVLDKRDRTGLGSRLPRGLTYGFAANGIMVFANPHALKLEPETDLELIKSQFKPGT